MIVVMTGIMVAPLKTWRFVTELGNLGVDYLKVTVEHLPDILGAFFDMTKEITTNINATNSTKVI